MGRFGSVLPACFIGRLEMRTTKHLQIKYQQFCTYMSSKTELVDSLFHEGQFEGGRGGHFISTKTKDMFMNERKREGRTNKWRLKKPSYATSSSYVCFEK